MIHNITQTYQGAEKYTRTGRGMSGERTDWEYFSCVSMSLPPDLVAWRVDILEELGCLETCRKDMKDSDTDRLKAEIRTNIHQHARLE